MTSQPSRPRALTHGGLAYSRRTSLSVSTIETGIALTMADMVRS